MRVWLNGGLLADPSVPAVAVSDHGLTVGDGVFETVKVVDGRPFALTRHLERLAHSAGGLGLAVPGPDEVRRAVSAVVGREPLGRLRIMVTGGTSPLGSARGDGPPTLLVAYVELAPPAPTAAIVTVPWRRNEHGAVTGLKTTSYAENVIALGYAHDRDATEAVFANTAGRLCEATGANVFCVFGDDVLTPPLASGCLAGVTRGLVLEWCGAVERDLPMSALTEADEVFITGTTRDVQPVHACDGRILPAPGRVSRRITAEFTARARANPDP